MKQSWMSQKKAESKNRRIASAFMVTTRGERLLLGDLATELRMRRLKQGGPDEKIATK